MAKLARKITRSHRKLEDLPLDGSDRRHPLLAPELADTPFEGLARTIGARIGIVTERREHSPI